MDAAHQSQHHPLEDGEEVETSEETNQEAFQNSQTQVETNEGGFDGHADVQENTGSEILDSREYSALEDAAWASDDVSRPDSLCSSSHESSSSESGEIVNAERVDVEEEPCEEPASPCDLYFDLTSTVNAELGSPAEPTGSNPVLLGGDLTDPPNVCQETSNAASISVVGTGPDGDGPDEAGSRPDSGAHAEVSPAHETSLQRTGPGGFYSNMDGSLRSEELEPMDLFYPDKEDGMLTDPAEAEAEFLPSVFGVFALQPAPASEPLLQDIDHTWEETDVVPDYEDYDNGEELAMERMEEVPILLHINYVCMLYGCWESSCPQVKIVTYDPTTSRRHSIYKLNRLS